MTIDSILGSIIIGLIIGALGRLVVPGRQNIPIWLTIIVGIIAAFIGSWIARLIGVQNTPGIDWWEIIIQVIVAAILVYAVAALWARRGAARS